MSATAGDSCLRIVQMGKQVLDGGLEHQTGFSSGLDSKRICLQCRRPVFNPWLGRSPREGNGNPLQYSCLENPMDREAWQVTVHGVAKSQTSLSD